ncbi:MAG: EAL domain-containing protein [Pseudolabrys sp.]
MGVVAPAYFIPAANDPYLHALSRFVIARALADSSQFASANHPVRASIPLPLLALEDMQFIDWMLERLSEKARQNGVDCIDLVNDYALVQRIGAQLAQRNIGIAISDIDAEGAALAACRDLPVVEMKINRRLIRGCATGSSRCNARKSLGLRGAPALKGVEKQSDFLAVRELGFDLIQGQMFAKPMAPRKFERTMLAQNYAAVA